MDHTERYALPLLAPGQAQKEWFHNEALQRIDMLLSAVVEGLPQADPPADPVPGRCYLVSDGATGAWAGREGTIAGYSQGGWRFVLATDGTRAMVRTSGEAIVRANGSWECGVVRAQQLLVGGLPVVGSRQPGVPLPDGGPVVDSQARAAIANIVAALSAHGLVGA